MTSGDAIFSLGAVLAVLNALATIQYDRESDEYQRQGNWKECGRSALAAAESFPRPSTLKPATAMRHSPRPFRTTGAQPKLLRTSRSSRRDWEPMPMPMLASAGSIYRRSLESAGAAITSLQVDHPTNTV
jgi:hypothetical protein